MRIDFLLLADAAEVSNGKLYLLGGAWDLFQAPVFPTVTRVGVAVGVLFEKHEIDRLHRLSLKVSEVNGHDLLPPLEVELRPQPRMVSTESIRALFAINPSLQIPGPGIYEVKAKIGEWEQAERFQAIVRSETASSGMEGTP
jgi:hypothetical protein